MRVNYFQIWHRQLRQAIEPLTPREAETRDKTGKPYVAVIGSEDHPDCFIEISRGFYGVSFLDPYRREYLMYSFEEIEPGKLFLREAIFREYDSDASKPLSASAYRFQPDGVVQVETGANPFNQAVRSSAIMDVSNNWEQKPSFGEYASIVQKERLLGGCDAQK
ncbi:MAG: hypothetical protein ACYC7A_22385 [Thermoanaerobaculia bacterium]